MTAAGTVITIGMTTGIRVGARIETMIAAGNSARTSEIVMTGVAGQETAAGAAAKSGAVMAMSVKPSGAGQAQRAGRSLRSRSPAFCLRHQKRNRLRQQWLQLFLGL